MKHLCRRFKSQLFAGAVIQSVFDHLNFLVRNACHLALLGHDRVPAFALHHGDDGLLVGRTNDGVAFPMTHLQALVNERWALAQGPAVGNLSPAVSTTGVALSLLLLATQVLPQGAAMRLVCINMQVQRFMAHWQLAGDLL